MIWKIFKLTAIMPIVLTACAQPEPICDREAQAWEKFGTREDVCMVTPVTIDGLPDGDDPHDPVSPPSQPPSEPPTGGKVKGNNGWGNGDQSAPGKSLHRNNAENNGSGKTHPKHGDPKQN